MGRPKVPLLSRDLVLNAALQIVDREGLEGLSIRRLADELSVNGASLYHHFSSKDEIVVGAAELALAQTPLTISEMPSGDWRMWLAAGARQLRDLLLAHPHFIPIIVRRRSLRMAEQTIDAVARRLVRHGVAIEVIVPMLDALEQFIIGTALRQSALEKTTAPVEQASSFPTLDAATERQLTSQDQLFDAAIFGIVDAITTLGHPGSEIVSEPVSGDGG